MVEYGIGSFALDARGSSKLLVNGEGNETIKQYIHRVTLPSLSPGSKYGKFRISKSSDN